VRPEKQYLGFPYFILLGLGKPDKRYQPTKVDPYRSFIRRHNVAIESAGQSCGSPFVRSFSYLRQSRRSDRPAE